MTGNRRYRSGAALPGTGAAAVLFGATRRRFAGAARFVAAAVLVCAGVEAQAQSFYLDDVNLAPNIIRVNAAAGTDVSGITPRVIAGSTIIQNNVTYSLAGSALFTVNAATGAIRSAGAFDDSHLGHYPVTLTATHGGETDDLPLTIGVHPVGGFYICDRNNTIQNKILERTAAADVCNLVSTDAMAAITEMEIVDGSFTSGTLFDYDLWGMSGLETLAILHTTTFQMNDLSNLSPDVFSGLNSLSRLILNNARNAGSANLTEYPARLLADLERRYPIDFAASKSVNLVGRDDSDVVPRINGIRYYLDGRAVSETLITEVTGGFRSVNRVFAETLVLDEGARHNFEIEVIGGVRSTLTLVFQGDSQLPITVTPPTIRIPPFSNRATVMLEAPMDVVGGQIGNVSWAWNRFNRVLLGHFGRNVTEEIRTPNFRVTVRSGDRFEDTNLAPNEISEAALAGDSVSGWSPQVLVGGVTQTRVSYSLSSDADGLFEIHPTSGTLSVASGQRPDFTASPYEVTVVAQAGSVTAMLTVPIVVTPALTLLDADPSTNIVAAGTATPPPVTGFRLESRYRGQVVQRDDLVYSLTGPGSDLFRINYLGMISPARLFTDDDIGVHSMTMTARCNIHFCGDEVGSLQLTIDIRDAFVTCDRTPEIVAEIRTLIMNRFGSYDCNFVPAEQLASITTLSMGESLRNVTALLPHDFDGLSGLEELDLGNNLVNPLPDGIFDDLSNLRVLNLRDSRSLTALSPDSFANLDRLQTLHLPRTSEFRVPARLLADLEKSPPVVISALDDVRIEGLQYRLDGVPITESATETTVVKFDEGVRHRFQVRVAGGVRSTLTLVARRDAELPFTVMPQTIEFSPQSNVAVIELMVPPDLNFADSIATSVTEVVSWGAWNRFRPSESVAEIRTRGWRVSVSNTETLLLEDTDPSPNTITMGAAEGTPVAGVAPTVRVGRAGGTVVITDGVRYALDGSVLFGVNPTSGVIFARQTLALHNLGRHPVTLLAISRNTVASLPLTIGVHFAGGFEICDRTPVVRNEILRLVNEGGGTHRCSNVPSASLSSIQTLDFSANPATDVRTLLVDDFQGLSGLTNLNLRALGLQRLPPDIFRSLAGLENLDLSGNDHLELPARLLADLEKSPAVTAGFDADVRIGGVQYRVGGETVTGIALDEEESRNIRIEVVGGVHTTLTLVARTDGSPPPTVTPAIIRFSPFSGADAVAVDVTAPEDPDFESSTGSVSWAWTRFSAAGSATEIRTQGLRLDVRELDTFEDSNPAPNEISEAAAVGAIVSGWSPQVRVDGVIEPAVSYALSPDAGPDIGNLFRIDSATGALSLVAERALNYAMSSSHQITVVAEVTDSGVTATLAVTIEVTPGFVIRDADPLVNTIAATAARGTPVGGLTVVARVGGSTLTSGVLYSLVGPDLFEVNRASGRVSAARPLEDTDVGRYAVTMTASYNRNVWSLPLTIEVRAGISICDRTPQIRNAIVELIDNLHDSVDYNCHAVLPEDLASIGALNLAGRLEGVTALRAHDFNGMPALQNLDLGDLEASSLPQDIFRDTTGLSVLSLRGSFRRGGLTSLPSNIFRNLGQLQNLDLSFTRFADLPEDIFGGTASLHTLSLANSGLTSLPPNILMNLDMLASLQLLGNNNLTELPARLLADLEKTRSSVGVNAGVRIGDIQYRADGAITTALTLSEGEGRNLQVEAVGGVGGTLTLVFRPSVESRFTATPPTVQLTPSRSTAAVTLTVPVDPNLGDRSGPASWAWTNFNSLGGATEVRAPDLQVTVNDTHRFEDADPAPNEISETAPVGAIVSGWSPQVIVGGVTATNVRYSLSSDAGGLFEIDVTSGTLSLALGQTLDYAAAPAHQITVIAQLTGSDTTASLAATIDLIPELLLRDSDPLVNSIAATAATGTPVVGVAPQARLGNDILTDGVTYTLTGSDLFTVNPTSGVISSARLLTEGDAGEYPVTLTATRQDDLASLPLTIDVRPGVSVCDRTPAIRDEIVRLISSPEARYDCRFVPSDRLASISTLNLSGRLDGVTALLAHDFDGMTGLEYLNLRGIATTSLPDAIFSDLQNLRVLDLQNSRLASLPPRLLADLERPPRVTAGFDAGVRIGGIQYRLDGGTITELTLDERESRTLQVEIDGGVHSTLTLVFRTDGGLFTATPAAIEFGPFSNTNTAVVELAALPDLDPADGRGTVSWAWEMFDPATGGAAEIRTRQLQMNVLNTETVLLEDADPSPNTIAVSAAQGTNVAGVAPTLRVGGVAVTTGVAYTLTGSALFAVHSTSGAIYSTRPVRDGDRGSHLVTLSASYRSGAGSLLLAIGVHPAGGFDICNRTPVVQQEILSRVNAGGASYECSNIPAASLASVQTLDFSGYPATVGALLPHDLEGLSGLTNLNLDSLGLRRLPPGIFNGLPNLRVLGLQRNSNLELPAQVVADLERLRLSELRLDNGVRVGGIQYRLDGGTITGLTLAERESRNLRIEIDGGVRSTLTLVVRTDGAQPPAVTPQTVRFGPPFGSDAAVVELTAPGDDNFESSTGSVSWAWTMFNRGSGEAVEIRTQGLPVNVRELDRFEDIAPAANRISVTASPGDLVVGWSPRVLVSGVTETSVRYSLSSDAGGLFRINAASGALSLAPGRTLDYTISPSHEITAVAEVVDSGVMASLAATIEVVPLPVIRDADSSSANVIAVNAARGTPVEGVALEALSGSEAVTGGVVWSLAGGGGLFTVNAASGVISAARQIRDGDIGMHSVTVRAAFNFGVASLPLVIEVGISICRRTRQVRDEIVRRINSQSGAVAYNCRVIPPASLASVSTLSLPRIRVSAWWPTNFHGMPGLESLDLSYLYAIRPPAGHFTALTNLRVLNLERSLFLSLQSGRFVFVSLPSDIFRNLRNLENLNLEGTYFDPSVPDVFMNLGRLEELNLSRLGQISLPEGIFSGTPNLRVLSLAGSPSVLPPNIFRNLGRLEELDLDFALATTSLPEVIFSGLSNLRELNLLENDSLESLPPDIFMSLDNLEWLNLSLNFSLRELPARLLANLERPNPVTIGFDRHVRISGIQYRLDGATTTALTLNEGGSRDLRVEVVGDIGSTLTLAFRSSAESRFTATPSTVHLTSSRRSVPVTLSVPVDPNLGDRSGPALWAWTSFDSLGRVTEVRAPDLQVTVRDTHRFEDADPAPNRIGETAPAGVAVSGWSPRVLMGGVVQAAVRYSLPSDAGGLFQIHPETGVLSLISGGALDYTASSSHEITVEAAASGVTASLAATIEVFTLALEDADPAVNIISATAPQGTPVSGVEPVLLVDGVAIEGNIAYTLAGPAWFTVNPVSGVISAARRLTGGDSGSWPVTLTATYLGAPADLPLTIDIPAGPGLFICNRTVAVQEEILRRVNSQTEVQNRIAEGNPPYSCNDVPAANMALVQLLDLSAHPTTVTTLLNHDFEGLPGLTNLTLDSLGLESLPPDIFSGLSSLRALDLSGNDNLELPAQAVADLEGLRLTELGVDRDVRISGFEYRPGIRLLYPEGGGTPQRDESSSMMPFPTFGGGQTLLLDERQGYRLRVGIAGGVRSTLTLVLRVDGAQQFTVTPTTVRFSPLSNTDTAVVELTALAYETVGRDVARMSWAWTMFNSPDGAATEIRTQHLSVEVNDGTGLVDTDPADNRISEAASAGDLVSGWSPQVLLDGVTATNVRYSLSSNAGGLFEIHPTSGTLSLVFRRMLDYETSSVHTVRVVGRAHGETEFLTTAIFVDNAPELSLSGVVDGSISETAATGTAVSGIGVSLLDDGVSRDSGIVYELEGEGSHTFALAVSGNVAGLDLANAPLNYGTTPVYTLTLRAEYLGASATTQITVNVLDVLEAVMLEAEGTLPYRVREDAALDMTVGAVAARTEIGARLAQGVSYTLAGSELFAVTNAGDIIVAGQLDYEASTSHILFVTASSEGLISNQLRVDIAVLDIANDLQLVDQSSAENIASNTTGGQVRGLDLVFQIDGVNQAGAASAWRLPADAGLFDINSATGAITLRRRLVVVPSEYRISVAATWTGGDGVPRTPPPLPMNVEVNDGIPVRIRVFLEGAVIP